jgi:hypothetical protein
MQSFQDSRLRNAMCAYCFEKGNTADHSPSKILLDEPFPPNLITVLCCLKCNNEISADELYFACALECAEHGTTDPLLLYRDKIKKALANDRKLNELLTNSFVIVEQQKQFLFDDEIFRRVLTKLVRAHVRSELDEYETKLPSQISFTPIHLLNDKQRASFLAIPSPRLLPEIGSKAFQKLLQKGLEWNVVQPRTYQYSLIQDSRITVKLLIRNWFAIQAVWN